MNTKLFKHRHCEERSDKATFGKLGMTVALALLLFAAGCKEDAADAYFLMENQNATAIQPEVNLPAGADTLKYTLSSDAAWSIEPVDGAAGWATFDPAAGNARKFVVISLNIEANEGLNNRSAQFSVRQNGVEQLTIRVTQATGGPVFTLPGMPDPLPVDGGDLTLAIATNVPDWTYTVTGGNWLTEKTKTVSELVLVAMENSGKERSVTLTFASTAYPDVVAGSITVAQDGWTPFTSPDKEAELLLKYLDGAGAQTAVTFAWEDLHATTELHFSKSPDMSSPIVINMGTGNSKTFTHDELQALIENAANELKRYYRNTLYWNVYTSGDYVATARRLYLSGQRKFVDVRSDETITYEVAVVDNQYYKGIWMAENLRTRKYADGTDIASWMIYEPLPQGTPPAGYNYTTAPGWKGGMVTPPDNPRIGYYYRPEWGVLFTGGASDVLAPAGWITPVKIDWDALYAAAEAAAAAAGSSDPIGVLKDPVAYGSQSFGAWGVNLSPAGGWDREEPPGYTINFGYISYTKQGDSESGNNTYEYQGVGSRGNHWDTSCVRLKYIGDE